MKLKLFSIFMAIAVALAFTSCDNKKKKVRDDDDSEKSERSDSTSTDKDSSDDIAEFNLTGDPEKDSKACEDLLVKYQEIMMAMQEADLKIIEYYADKGDYDGYEKFNEKIDNLAKKINRQYERKRDRISDKKVKAREKLNASRPMEQVQPASEYDDYDYSDKVEEAVPSGEEVEEYEYQEYK